MATTTNYGWTTPDDTGLVKDGASAIRSLGTSVDTTTKNLNPSTTLGDIEYRSSTANTNTRLGIGSSGQALTVVAGAPAWAASPTSVLTTTGDLLYASGANTLARRAIGSTGDILTVSGGLPTWATPSAASSNYVLLNSGGTALTGAATITVSGISGKDSILVYVDGASADSSNTIDIRFNSDSGSNYTSTYIGYSATSAYSLSQTTDVVKFGQMGNTAAQTVSGYVLMWGCNSSGLKVGVKATHGTGSTTNNSLSGIQTWNNSSTVSSVSVVQVGSNNFDAGRVYVYTTA